MSTMSLNEAKKQFKNVLVNLKNSQKHEFLRWIAKNWDIKGLENNDVGVAALEDIAKELRKIVPLSGVLKSEKIYEPLSLNKEERDMTVHVDEFLFPDDVLDKMVNEEKISRHYCFDCGSKNVKMLDLITHSLSIEGMRFVFSSLLPPLNGKVLLDVGSRLGAILYGAYYFTSARKIIGIEINQEWCSIARNVVNSRNMQDRIDVVHSNITEQSEELSSADVIIVNNVFEYFSDQKEAAETWQFMVHHIKPGATLILSPKAEETFKLYDIGFPWTNWLTELAPLDDHHSDDDDDEFLNNITAYSVKMIESV